MCVKAEDPLRIFFVGNKFKRVRSTWHDGLQVNTFETSQHFTSRRISGLFLIRQQNEMNYTFVKDVIFLFPVDDLTF